MQLVAEQIRPDRRACTTTPPKDDIAAGTSTQNVTGPGKIGGLESALPGKTTEANTVSFFKGAAGARTASALPFFSKSEAISFSLRRFMG